MLSVVFKAWGNSPWLFFFLVSHFYITWSLSSLTLAFVLSTDISEDFLSICMMHPLYYYTWTLWISYKCFFRTGIPWFITPPAHQFIISKVYLVLPIYLFAVWGSLTFIRWLWFISTDYNHRYICTYTIIKYVCFFNSPAVASFLVICTFKFFSTNVEYMCASPWFLYTHRAVQSASQSVLNAFINYPNKFHTN